MLNKRTIKDVYAFPRIEEVFGVFHGAKFHTSLDMKGAYHHVETEPAHRERPASTLGPVGFYEYLKMPFGLSNSPSTYQRRMEEVLDDYSMTICVIYLDYLVIFEIILQEHICRLDKVLTGLKEHDIKLSTENCFYIQTSVSFLGHVVSEWGVKTDPSKIKRLRTGRFLKMPKNQDILSLSPGITASSSKITKPLTDLISGSSPRPLFSSSQVTRVGNLTPLRFQCWLYYVTMYFCLYLT